MTYRGKREHLVCLNVEDVTGYFPAVLGLIDDELCILKVVILKAALKIAVSDYRIRLRETGKSEVVVLLAVEAPALVDLAVQDIRPATFGEVELAVAALVANCLLYTSDAADEQ